MRLRQKYGISALELVVVLGILGVALFSLNYSKTRVSKGEQDLWKDDELLRLQNFIRAKLDCSASVEGDQNNCSGLITIRERVTGNAIIPSAAPFFSRGPYQLKAGCTNLGNSIKQIDIEYQKEGASEWAKLFPKFAPICKTTPKPCEADPCNGNFTCNATASAATPIVLRTRADFNHLQHQRHYVLANDIDFAGEPVANADLYQAVFDGKGFTLKNVEKSVFGNIISSLVTNVKIDNVFSSLGLMSPTGALGGSALSSCIQNVEVKNLNVSTNSNIGVLLAAMVGSQIKNVRVENSTILGGDPPLHRGGTAGLVHSVGMNGIPSEISDCVISNVTLSPSDARHYGGIIAAFEYFGPESNLAPLKISNCTVNITLQFHPFANSSHGGGIYGAIGWYPPEGSSYTPPILWLDSITAHSTILPTAVIGYGFDPVGLDHTFNLGGGSPYPSDLVLRTNVNATATYPP